MTDALSQPRPHAISLVIPTFNRAELLRETLEAAVNQSQVFEEIIVVDDGSTDHTDDVIKLFGAKIRTVKTSNQGVQAARNLGVELVKSEWVAFCDSDDLLAPDYLFEMSGIAAAPAPIDIVFCNFLTFDQHGAYPDKFSQAPAGYFEGSREWKNFLYQVPDLYLHSVQFQAFFQSGMVVKREFFHRIGGFNQDFKGVGAEDWEFTLRAISCGHLAVNKKVLAKVRKHASNDSGDAVRMNLGEAQILEFGLQHHPGASTYTDQVMRSVNERRLRAFDGLFAKGDLDKAAALVNAMSPRPDSLNFRLKCAVLALPKRARHALWRLSQWIDH